MNNELDTLEKDIRKNLEDGEAALSLDRLHTYTIKVVKEYCSIHNIDIKKENGEDQPLHSLVGMLVKDYKENDLISDFSKQALKQTISIYEKFNNIRNDNSYAHDNDVLSNEESLYVVNCMTNMLNFLNYVETGQSQLIDANIVSLDDIYEYICLNYATTTKKIADHFNISIEETKDCLMKLYKVYESIHPAFIDNNPNEDNCQWVK